MIEVVKFAGEPSTADRFADEDSHRKVPEVAATMFVLPVLDVLRGRAVAALGGDRGHYVPASTVLEAGPAPVDLARAFRDQLGFEGVYLADLDAIEGHSPPSVALYRDLDRLGLRVWVDAGVRSSSDLKVVLDAGVALAIVGLETVDGPAELARMVEAVGPDRLAFSLDLVDGRPIVPTFPRWGTEDPERLVDQAVEASIRRVIHLDLARVGTGRGLSRSALLPRLGVDWIVGGGIAGPDDLDEVGRLGMAGALVGRAIRSGRISRLDLDARPWISGRRTS